ncbi:glycoside hydrolase family 30 protein [Clostridium thermarum]|uniref:glycoside hydrolase family 30 protein n=1 Tax=Clostridium thermarum TaxID=1716543 RepID=UPI001A9AA1AE|nr:glycoside hydrolase family 30 beta sandwich domain-containing protein [Clostridium thermarum]
MKKKYLCAVLAACSLFLFSLNGCANTDSEKLPENSGILPENSENLPKDSEKYPEDKPLEESVGIEGMVELWLTSSNQKNLLTAQQPIIPHNNVASESSGEVFAINVEPDVTFQEMDGFGASFTDASAWLVANVLDDKQRQDLMEKLFDADVGIGMSFLRQPMGATDFTTKLYTYNDLPAGETDVELSKFSIAHDKKYIIPLLKEARKINPKMKIMASPWSAPAWMKTSKNLIGGSLNPDYYGVYAEYFVKYIKAYENEDIPIYAVTPQNEPMYVPSEYPGMKMDFSSQVKFINKYLGPAFEKNNISTKIIAYDHNWDNLVYPTEVLKEAGKYVAGTAWHCYGGKHQAMTTIHDKFPDKGIWFTEASGGEWVPPFNEAFVDQMTHVIRATRNYAKTVVWWNIALDQNNGPTVLSNSTCRGIVTINTDTKEITYNVDYYTMGHISKFVEPGALRIESTNVQGNLETTAFKNPDGSVVLIAFNHLPQDRTIRVNYGKSSFEYKFPGKSAVTFRW